MLTNEGFALHIVSVAGERMRPMQVHFWQPGSRVYTIDFEIVQDTDYKLVLRSTGENHFELRVAHPEGGLKDDMIPPKVTVHETSEDASFPLFDRELTLRGGNGSYEAYLYRFFQDGLLIVPV